MINFFRKKTPEKNIFIQWVHAQPTLRLTKLVEVDPGTHHYKIIINNRLMKIYISQEGYYTDDEKTTFKFGKIFVSVTFSEGLSTNPLYLNELYLDKETCERVYECFLENLPSASKPERYDVPNTHTIRKSGF